MIGDCGDAFDDHLAMLCKVWSAQVHGNVLTVKKN